MGKLKWVIIAGGVVVVLGAGGYLLYRQMHAITSIGMTDMNMSSTSSSTSTTVSTNTVAIKNFAFSPANITVKKGTTVTWTNNDSASHTVTETDDLKGPDSPTLSNGQTYNFTFDAVGSYHYRCNFHPSMIGTVTVTK